MYKKIFLIIAKPPINQTIKQPDFRVVNIGSPYTLYVVYLAVALIWQFGKSRKFNVCHLGYKNESFHTVL